MRPLEVNELPHCANCGQLTTWQTKNKTFEGKNLNFCGDNCLSVFETYLLPLHGKKFLDTLDVTCFVK
tara:strand:+ start:43 stop:246 length:204 start_codon:yes stop_codon:yes gene_type:complete